MDVGGKVPFAQSPRESLEMPLVDGRLMRTAHELHEAQKSVSVTVRTHERDLLMKFISLNIPLQGFKD